MPETVADIIADTRKQEKQPKNDLQKAVGRLRKIDRLLDRLVAAARPETDTEGWEDWQLVYSAIFSGHPSDIKPRTDAALDLVGASFPDYCDPDTTYEADVRAWIETFKEVLARLEARLGGKDRDGRDRND